MPASPGSDFASARSAITVGALREAYRAGASPTDTVAEVYARIETLRDNPVWIHLVPRDEALARAAELSRLSRQEAAALPLFGVPFAVKDNIDVGELPTTAACPDYRYVAPRGATAVRRLLDAGAILVGKTNLDQFATGLVGTRSPYGVCRNAFDPAFISGGSSSGSAIAVASAMCSFSLGTDTAGSGRVPAAFNDLVGLKPTRGVVSTGGVVPACRSLDCVSVFATSCADALSVFDVLEGFDPGDPYSRTAGEPVAFPAGRFRFAVPEPDQLEFFGDTEYAALFDAAQDRLESLGGERVGVDLTPFLKAQALLYEGPWIAERTAALGQFIAAHPAGVHPVTRAVIETGARFSAADLFRAQHELAALKRETDALWRRAEVMLVPGAPTIYRISEVEANPVELNSRLGLYTNFVNLLDLAAITVPAGFRPDGLPFGVTFVGPAFADRALAALGARFHGEPPLAVAHEPTVRVAVAGAHLSGMPLNSQLTSRGARLLRATRTAPLYRMYALDQELPPKPGLVRAAEGGQGSRIEVEVWEMPVRGFGAFVAEIPPPLGIGTLQLEDGERVKGFLCEHHALAGRRDISEHGSWRTYLDSKSS